MRSESEQLSFLTATSKYRNWFDHVLAVLNVSEAPGWPDAFGAKLKFWRKRQGIAPIPTLSLFSGGGGLDIAFHDAGFDILEMVEIDERFAATLAYNSQPDRLLHGGRVICTDIREYHPSPDLKVDFIIGGPPCQTFSAAGRRASGVKGTNDPRGTLFEEYVRILQQLKPAGFLFENVYGIVGAESGGPWTQIQSAFIAAGYRISSRILDAADYGVPQHRERLFIVGQRVDVSKDDFHFPRPTHGPDAMPSKTFYAAGKAVQGVSPNDRAGLEVGGRWKSLLSEIPPGLNYSYYTSEMGHPHPVFAWRSKFSDFLYKADPDVPVRTIKAQGGSFTGPLSWENRHFSSLEMKRLQTFPDSYTVIGNRGAQIHQIGNSVPPQMARILAMSVLDQLFDVPLPAPVEYLSPTDTLGFRHRKRALTAKYRSAAAQAIAALTSNTDSRATSDNFSGNEHFSIGPQFSISKPPKSKEVAYHVEYRGVNSELSIIMDRPGAAPGRFTLHIHPANDGWNILLKSIVVECSSGAPEDLTACWKYLDLLIREQFRIDDLVQLSGYYQYTPKLAAKVTYIADKIPNLWGILQKISAGSGVARQITLDELSALWGCNEASALSALHDLRSIGFEVRSNSTNPQIANGEYLIPYRFPTLNPRSVQLFKKL